MQGAQQGGLVPASQLRPLPGDSEAGAGVGCRDTGSQADAGCSWLDLWVTTLPTWPPHVVWDWHNMGLGSQGEKERGSRESQVEAQR